MSCPFHSSNPSDPEEVQLDYSYSIKAISPFQESIDYCELPELHKKRIIFNSYPIYLKNTLFHASHTKQLRTLELRQRLVYFNEFKRQGNIHFHSEEFERAQECYEHAYGLLKYLKFLEVHKTITDDIISLSSFKPRCSHEAQTYSECLKQILSNMSKALIKTKNLEEARKALEEAGEDPSAVLVFDLGTESETLEQLVSEDAKKRLTKIRDQEKKLVSEIISWLEENPSEPVSKELEFEYVVTIKMMQKYYEILKYYYSMHNYTQVQRVKDDMDGILEMYHKMKFYQNLNSGHYLIQEALMQAGIFFNFEFSLEAFKRFKISSAFNEAKYNDKLLDFCIEKCSEEKKTHKPAEEESSKSLGCTGVLLGVLSMLILYFSIFQL